MLQPNYIPWKGVFDIIDRVDTFVFYDDVQYTKRDWRNRNKIKTPQGDQWLSVPVKASRNQLISEVLIDTETDWQKKHLKTLTLNYKKSPFFKEYDYLLEEIYEKKTWKNISELNIFATKILAKSLDISTNWINASDLQVSGGKDGEKVIKICKQFSANYFLNGPSSKSFMDDHKFKDANIELAFMDYQYTEYDQLYPPFSHFVTVLDVIFNCGPDARKYICTKDSSL